MGRGHRPWTRPGRRPQREVGEDGGAGPRQQVRPRGAKTHTLLLTLSTTTLLLPLPFPYCCPYLATIHSQHSSPRDPFYNKSDHVTPLISVSPLTPNFTQIKS